MSSVESFTQPAKWRNIILLFLYYLVRRRVGHVLKSVCGGISNGHYGFCCTSWIWDQKFASMSIRSAFN